MKKMMILIFFGLRKNRNKKKIAAHIQNPAVLIKQQKVKRKKYAEISQEVEAEVEAEIIL